MAVEEIASRVISHKPIPVQQKIVRVIGKNELFDLDALCTESRHEVHRLREVDVAVVVTVNKKHGRFPSVHGGHR